MRWVALIALTTGCALDSAFGPCRGKETGETALFRQLLGTLRKGDVLVADRYYCSYRTVALARQLGVDVVFRQHQGHGTPTSVVADGWVRRTTSSIGTSRSVPSGWTKRPTTRCRTR